MSLLSLQSSVFKDSFKLLQEDFEWTHHVFHMRKQMTYDLPQLSQGTLDGYQEFFYILSLFRPTVTMDGPFKEPPGNYFS